MQQLFNEVFNVSLRSIKCVESRAVETETRLSCITESTLILERKAFLFRFIFITPQFYFLLNGIIFIIQLRRIKLSKINGIDKFYWLRNL
jgi:hypothetical protein